MSITALAQTLGLQTWENGVGRRASMSHRGGASGDFLGKALDVRKAVDRVASA